MAKRGQGEGTIAKRADGTWWARITVGRTADGKQKRKAFYGKTRKEVQEKLTAALNDINNNTYIEPSNMTIAQWMERWLEDYKKHYLKPQTYSVYYRSIQKHINPILGNYSLKTLKNSTVQGFVNKLIEEGISPKSIKEYYQILVCALNQAVENELIGKNPALKVKLPPKKQKESRVLTREEQEKFIELARKTTSGDIFILILVTGLRIGEAMALTWDDIDFENELLKVNKTRVEYTDYTLTKPKLICEVGTPKTQSSYRTIPLIPSAIELLREVERKQNIIKTLNDKYQDNNLVFCTRKGTAYIRANLQRTCGDIARHLEIKGIHIHSLRHTFATRGLEQGIELKVMQELLGHASINMTADLYTHVLADTKKEAIMKLEDIM